LGRRCGNIAVRRLQEAALTLRGKTRLPTVHLPHFDYYFTLRRGKSQIKLPPIKICRRSFKARLTKSG